MHKLLTGVIFILCLTSCKVTRNVQNFTRHVDSTGFFKRDSISVRHIDSTHVENDKKIQHEEVKNDYEEWIITEEFKDTPIVRKTTVHIRDKGVRKSKVVVISKDSAHLKKSDSGSAKTVAVARVLTDEKGKDLNVKKTQGGLWWNLAILLAIALGAYYLYRRYFR